MTAEKTKKLRPPFDRTDFTQKDESWAPPPYSSPGKRPIVERLRRFFDLQAASVWRDVSAQLPLVRGEVLDVGCGAQPYRHLFGPEAHYRGIDHETAKSNFGYDHSDTTYFSGNRWPIEDASIDFLLCTETMEHVPDPTAFLGEAKRVLRSGGRILLTVPFSARFHFIPHDYWRYTPTSLDMLLRAAGFDEVAVFARGNAVTVCCYKTIALLLPLLMPQGKRGGLSLLLQLIALPFVPIALLLAVIANISLRGTGGDDCLGFTTMARRC